MKCPRCGAQTDVLETRPWEYGTTYRRRVCHNNHRFTTVEIYRETYGSVKQRAQQYAQSVSVWRKRWERNLDIFRRQHLGWKHFSEQYNITRASYFLILKQMREHLGRKK